MDSPFKFATWYAINWRGIIEIIVDNTSDVVGKVTYSLDMSSNFLENYHQLKSHTHHEQLPLAHYLLFYPINDFDSL